MSAIVAGTHVVVLPQCLILTSESIITQQLPQSLILTSESIITHQLPQCLPMGMAADSGLVHKDDQWPR